MRVVVSKMSNNECENTDSTDMGFGELQPIFLSGSGVSFPVKSRRKFSASFVHAIIHYWGLRVHASLHVHNVVTTHFNNRTNYTLSIIAIFGGTYFTFQATFNNRTKSTNTSCLNLSICASVVKLVCISPSIISLLVV